MPSVVVPLLDASFAPLGPSTGQPTSASGPEEAPTFVIRIVTMAGHLQTELTDAEADTITWTLNAPDEAEFHFPKNAYTASQIAVLGTSGGAKEVQIYRNGDLLFWGPIISLEANGNSGQVTCRCAGVDWYLNRRFLDGFITNILSNTDFESGTGSWVAHGGATFTSDSTTFLTGQRSAKLVNAVAGADAYISQDVMVGPSSIGEVVTVSAWFQIESITAPPYASPWHRGIWIGGYYNDVFQTDNGYVIEMATERGKWVKASATLFVPPNQTWHVAVRLYAPQGTIYWDDVKLVKMLSTGDGERNASGTLLPIDINELVYLMVQSVQGQGGQADAAKSDLNIGIHTVPTGTKLIKIWQWVDHVQFDQALREFIERVDGIDYYIRITPTTRTFHMLPGKRGTDLSGSVTLEYAVTSPSTRNCTDYRFQEDGGACITRQTILGEDNGPAREQGEAEDTSNIGGTTLEDVRQAPHDTDVGSLTPLAEERIARYSTVPQTIEMDVVGSSGLIPTIHCGDLVTVVISDGFVDISETMRIMRLSLNCRTNILTVTVTKDTLS